MAGAFKVRRFLHASTTTQQAVSIAPWGRQLLMSGSALTAINAAPSGNDFTLTNGVGSPIELSYGVKYVTGDAVIPAPSAAYQATGVEETGYTSWTEDGNARTAKPDTVTTGGLGDETRTTAKPCLRLATVWNQAFSGKMVLVFVSEAKGGLSKVRIYVEGGVLDITSQSWHHYTGEDGKKHSIYGYVCEIDAANYTAYGTNSTRGVRLYARAYPVDTSMQTQLVGVGTTPNTKHLFFPQPAGAEHDLLVYVDETLGSNDTYQGGTYPSVNMTFKYLHDAVSFCCGVTFSGHFFSGALRPRIEFVNSSSFHAPFSRNNNYNGRGFCTITTKSGVTNVKIGRTVYDDTPNADGSNVIKYTWRPGWNGVEFRGWNVILDNTWMNGVTIASTVQQHWQNGCRVTSDIDYSTHVSGGGAAWGSISAGWQTDCDMYHSTSGIYLNRNNTYRKVIYDLYPGDSLCAYGEVIIQIDASGFNDLRDAFTLTYSGAGAGSFQKTGNSGFSGLFKLIVNGSSTTGGGHEITITAGTTKLADIVTAINSFSGDGWAATPLYVVDDQYTYRNADALALGTGAGSIGVTALTTGVGYTIGTSQDVHADFIDTKNVTRSNQYWGKIQLWQAWVQPIFFASSTIDCALVDIFIDNDNRGQSGIINNANRSGTIIRNFVDVECALAVNNSGMSAGAWDYCVFEGNVFGSMTFQVTPSTAPAIDIKDCHFYNTARTATGLVTVTNCSSGDTKANLWPNIASSNCEPGGLLIDPANVISANSPVDCAGANRIGSTFAKGAKAVATGNATLTQAQAASLSAVCMNETVGSNVGTASIAYRSGVGNTGLLQTVQLNLSVEA